MPFERIGASSSPAGELQHLSVCEHIESATLAPEISLLEQSNAIQRHLGHPLIVNLNGSAIGGVGVPDRGNYTKLDFQEQRGYYVLNIDLRRGDYGMSVMPMPVPRIDLYQAAAMASSAAATRSTRVPLPTPVNVELFKACCLIDRSQSGLECSADNSVGDCARPEDLLKRWFPAYPNEKKMDYARRLTQVFNPRLSYKALALISGASQNVMRRDPTFWVETVEIQNLRHKYPRMLEETKLDYARWLAKQGDPQLTPPVVAQLSERWQSDLVKEGVFGPHTRKSRNISKPYTTISANRKEKVRGDVVALDRPRTAPAILPHFLANVGSAHKPVPVVESKLLQLERMFREGENIQELITVHETHWRCTGRQPVDKSHRLMRTLLRQQSSGSTISDAESELNHGIKLAKNFLKQLPRALAADLGWQTSYGSLVYLLTQKIVVLSVAEVPHPSFSAAAHLIQHLRKQYGARSMAPHPDASEYTKALLQAHGIMASSPSMAESSVPRDVQSPFTPQAMTPVPMTDLRRLEAWGMSEVQTMLRLVPAILPSVTSLPVYWGTQGMLAVENHPAGQPVIELKFAGNFVLHRKVEGVLALSCSARNWAYALSVALGGQNWRALCMSLENLAPHAKPQAGDYGVLLAEGCASFMEQNPVQTADLLKKALPFIPS